MAIRFVRPHRQARIQQQDPAISPRCQEPTILGWGSEGGIVFLKSGVHVLERGRGGSGWADGEAETMGLVDIVVGVLT